ncbi:MAG: hypothetical protein M3134_05235 [Actinomycetota bacterium]|nr:hypothetical protein [Actinomycetota bacterium]
MDATRAQLAIADFNDRRAEINNRTTAQHVLISLNITAAGAIAGVFFTMDDPDRSLLLMLVPVCAALTMLWANHARTVAHIGWYIRERIRPLVEPDKDGPLWRWEIDHNTFLDEHGNERTVHKWVTFIVPVMLTFAGPPLFALLYTFEEMFVHGRLESRFGYTAAAVMAIYGGLVLLDALAPGLIRTSSGRR